MPAHRLGAPRTSQRHYTHEHKDKLEDGSDKAMSISDYLDVEDSAACSREKADEPHSHQETKAETTTKEVEVRLRKPRYWGGPGLEYTAA